MSEIVFCPLETFVDAYPKEYFNKDENGLFHYDSSKVTVFSGIDDISRLFHQTDKCLIKLDGTTKCLKDWETKLTNNPILFLVDIGWVDASMTTYYSAGTYAVFIKPKHLHLRSQIHTAFRRIEKLQNAGRLFSLNITIIRMLACWARKHLPRGGDINWFYGDLIEFQSKPQSIKECFTCPLFSGGCFPNPLFHAGLYLAREVMAAEMYIYLEVGKRGRKEKSEVLMKKLRILFEELQKAINPSYDMNCLTWKRSGQKTLEERSESTEKNP